jgi:hypothetical protein
MGATRMFNDVFKWLVANNRHLDSGAIRTSSGENDIAANRLAVYQYPVFGFQKSKDDEGNDKYDFIGLYTIGPDKGDKETFGFDKNKDTLIHLEGADHGVASVGFEYPWSKMDFEDEVLGGIGKNGIEGAWEVGAAHDLDVAKDDENYDKAAVKAVLDAEWKPAYEVAQKNNPYVMGLTADEFYDMQHNPSEFRSRVVSRGEYKGLPYSYFEFYKQGEYQTYHFDVQHETFQQLGVNAVTDLGLDISGKPELVIESDIRQGRRARFKANAGNYWNVWDTIYHYTFMQWLGATDNFMKNTYPYKFKNLTDGGKWRWRQDDLDTIADVNNRGAAVKKYSILVGDMKDGNPIYVGDNSVFWTLVRECYPSEIREMGKNILDALAAISESGKTNQIEAVLEYFNKRWFAYAQNYFGIAGYNEDTEWTYEDIWGMKKAGNSYQTADPLLQALGSHYEAEYRWFYLRTIFFASLVGFGDFANYKQKFTGQISYRAGGAHTFHLVPAIDFAPMCILGDDSSYITDYQRKAAGEDVSLSYNHLEDTDVYLKGAHYITALGDLSALKTGANSGELIFAARMLRNIKIGDEDASKVTTNVNKLTLTECPSLEEIDARNAVAIGGVLNLANSPRISKALLEGTSITSVSLPNGAKIETLHLPNTITSLSFVKLPKLGGSGLVIGSYANLSTLRLEENPLMDDFEMLRKAYRESQGLSYIRVIGFDNQGTSADITMLKNLATESTESGVYRYSGITADGEPMASEMKSDAKRQYAPVIQGTLNLSTPVYKSELDKVVELYNADTLNINSDKYYIEFEDPEVKQVILEAGIGDGYGVMQTGTQYVDADEVMNQFLGTETNTGILQTAPITKFNELQYFTHPSLDLGMAFKDNHTIEELTMPRWTNRPLPIGIFWNATNLKKVHFPEGQTYTSIGSRAFEGTKISEIGFDISGLQSLNTASFKNCVNLHVDIVLNASALSGGSEYFAGSGIKSFKAPNLTVWGSAYNQLANCAALETLEIPKLNHIAYSFADGAISLKNIVLSEDIETIETYGFYRAFSEDSDIHLNFPKLKTLGYRAVSRSNIRTFTADAIETVSTNYELEGCYQLTKVRMAKLKRTSTGLLDVCPKLTEVDFPMLEFLEIATFRDCPNLTSVSFPNLKTISQAFQNGGLKTIYIPNIEVMNDNAFNSIGLEGSYQWRNLKTIGKYVFTSTKIKEVETNIVESIGNNAFLNCNELISYIQNTDTPVVIGEFTFSACSKLKSVNIKHLEEIGRGSFRSCVSLEEVNVENVVIIGDAAFYECSSLKGEMLMPKLTTLQGQFGSSTQITRIIAPYARGVNESNYAFQHNNLLTELVLGDLSITGKHSINQCQKLERVIFYFENVPQPLGTGNFDYCNDCLIYVPDNLVDTIKTITGWVGYASRIKSFSEGNIPTDKSAWFTN